MSKRTLVVSKGYVVFTPFCLGFHSLFLIMTVTCTNANWGFLMRKSSNCRLQPKWLIRVLCHTDLYPSQRLTSMPQTTLLMWVGSISQYLL